MKQIHRPGPIFGQLRDPMPDWNDRAWPANFSLVTTCARFAGRPSDIVEQFIRQAIPTDRRRLHPHALLWRLPSSSYPVVRLQELIS